MINMSRMGDIYKQKYSINELNNEIAKCDSNINALENKKKHFKKWACLPPIIVGAIALLGIVAFKASTGFADWATLPMIMGAAGPFLGVSLGVSAIFPVFYGYAWYNTNKEVKEKQDKRKYLEECLELNEQMLDSLESESDLTPQKENLASRWDIIREFCINEKDLLLELYNMGKLSECEKLGFSVDEIVYIQNWLEDLNNQSTLDISNNDTDYNMGESRRRIHP